MASNVVLAREFQKVLSNLVRLVQKWKLLPPHQGVFGAPAVALDIPCSDSLPPSRSQPVSVREIFDGILCHVVPKSRRSLEKRLTRKFGIPDFKHSKPKQNIIACLTCGHWHEKHTICGHCYEKVKEETKAMRKEMGEDTYNYNQPQEEVVYMYKGEEEDRPKYEGKYIVEMPKERPQWFPKQLTGKKMS